MPTKINDESAYVLTDGEFSKFGYVKFEDHPKYDLDVAKLLFGVMPISNNYRRYHGMRAIRWRKICRR